MAGDAFLAQRLEFLSAELEEYKAREAALKKMNDSLLEAMQQVAPSSLRDHTMSELEKVTAQYSKELAEAKARAQEDLLKSERSLRELDRRLKESELDQKQAEVSHTREKLELRETVRQLENDKAALAARVKALEEERGLGREAVKHELELKLHAAQRELSIQKEEARTELLKAREAADRTVAELKGIFAKESDQQKSQIAQLIAKCKRQHEKIMRLKEGNGSEEVYTEEIEKLSSELEALRSAARTPRYPTQLEEERDALQQEVEQLQFHLRQRESPERQVEPLRRSNEELRTRVEALQEVNLQLRSALEDRGQDLAQAEGLLDAKERELEGKAALLASLSREVDDYRCRSSGKGKRQCNLHWNSDMPLSTPKKHSDTCSTLLGSPTQEAFRGDLAAKDLRIQDLGMELERTQVQRDRAKVDMDKALFELRRLKIEWSKEAKLRESVEVGLRNEIKRLIGKVLKVKGKYAAVAELNETQRKEPVSRTLRPRSTARLRASPLQRGASPINLSVISRTGSPFGASELDLY